MSSTTTRHEGGVSSRKQPTVSYPAWEEQLAQRGILSELAAAARRHGILLVEVWGASRRRSVAAARVECFAAVRAKFPSMSALDIAQVMLCDRVTVSKALKRSNQAGEGSHGGQAG